MRKPKQQAVFPTADQERKFRYLLSKLPLLTKIYDDDDGNKVIAVRPKAVDHLRSVADKFGNPNPEILQKIIVQLNADPVLFIKFKHQSNG